MRPQNHRQGGFSDRRSWCSRSCSTRSLACPTLAQRKPKPSAGTISMAEHRHMAACHRRVPNWRARQGEDEPHDGSACGCNGAAVRWSRGAAAPIMSTLPVHNSLNSEKKNWICVFIVCGHNWHTSRSTPLALAHLGPLSRSLVACTALAPTIMPQRWRFENISGGRLKIHLPVSSLTDGPRGPCPRAAGRAGTQGEEGGALDEVEIKFL